MNQSSSNSLEQLFLTITPFAISFFIFGVIAFTVMIAYVIRLWLTQTATFQIQKDVADIRNHILGQSTESITPDAVQVIESGYVDPLAVKKKPEFKRPRKLFIWLAATVSCLFIFVVILLNLL